MVKWGKLEFRQISLIIELYVSIPSILAAVVAPHVVSKIFLREKICSEKINTQIQISFPLYLLHFQD